MTTREQIAVWLDGLRPFEGDDLYPGYLRKLRWPSEPLSSVELALAQTMALERGWYWASASSLGCSFMYRADLLDAEEERFRAKYAQEEGFGA